MRELSLFSGGGGGLLGSKLLGWTTLGYVEWNAYACRLLAQRIADGFLDDAPVYCGDVRDFIRDGYADCYKGVVDVVSAGFPCQEFSLANYMHAGQGTAGTGAKNQWPATIEIIRCAEPRYVLLENVAGLLGSHGYFGRVLSDLAAEGYDVRWETISGTEVGAPHVRRRVWIAGVRRWRRVMDAADMLECECCNEPYCPECETHYHECDCPGPSQDDEYDYREVSGILQARPKDVADSNGERCQEPSGGGAVQPEQLSSECGGGDLEWWREDPAEHGQDDQPRMGRMVDGVARGMDRLEALGNGQIPAVVREAWNRLTRVKLNKKSHQQSQSEV